MREEGTCQVEVHVAGICFNNKEVLAGRRTESRELFPGLWECGGGQVRLGEGFEDAVKRQFREEFGILVMPVGVVGVYEIDFSGGKIPGIVFACKFEGYVNGKSPQIDFREFSEWAWLPVSNLGDKEFIEGIPENIKAASLL